MNVVFVDVHGVKCTLKAHKSSCSVYTSRKEVIVSSDTCEHGAVLGRERFCACF